VAGSVVSRATLHNEDEIRRLGVRIGDTVVVQKAGDVIPDIVKVLTEMRTGGERPFEWPARIGACGGDGRIERIPGEAAWRCVDHDSFAIQRRKFYHFVGKHGFDIDGLGPKIVDALFERKLLASFPDIFALTRGDLLALPRFAEKSADNLLVAIEKARTVTLPKFLVSLSIPQVGEETAYDLAEHFGSLEKLRAASFEELEKIHGVGPVVGKSVADWFRDSNNRKLTHELLHAVHIERMERAPKGHLPLAGKTFVVTGTLAGMSREDAERRIRALGGNLSSSVSKKTDYAVVGENPGSKYEKAKTLGVTVLDERAFMAFLKK
jgi:DNA ligase (NAD+)